MFGELVKGRRILSMEKGHVNVRAADCSEGKEKYVPVNGMTPVNTAQLKLVTFHCKAFDGRQKVVTP